MAESSALSSSTPRSRVVRPIARAAERPCARPGCPAPARATLTFVYGAAEVHLDPLGEHPDPQGYDLCAPHAARTEAPRGWELTDRRPEDDRAAADAPAPPARDLGGEATVALLAAALRAVPEPSRTAVTAPAAPDELEPSGPERTEHAPAVLDPATTTPGAATGPSRTATAHAEPVESAGRRRRRTVVETLLSSSKAAAAEALAVDQRRDTRDEPTVELPRLRAPRRVPAAGDRGPATDW